MFLCPNCRIKLARAKTPVGIFWACSRCHGRSATISLLRRLIPKPIVNAVWQDVRSGAHPRTRPCPACVNRMAEVTARGTQGQETIDVCTACHFVWFDAQEYESLPKLADDTGETKKEMPLEARQKLALLEIENIRATAPSAETPDHFWKYIPAIFGMPVELETDAYQQWPILTWGLALVITIISILSFGVLEGAVTMFGLVPAEWFRFGGITLLTSFFLHGGFWHLIGNMYFLLVFGDNVEDSLGRWRYAILLMAATLGGHLVHILADPSSTIPCIGASGGISGILVFYALTAPHAKLGLMVRLGWMPIRWIHFPAWAMVLVWIALQAIGAMIQVSGFGHVSYMAHLGGALMGFLAWVTLHE